MAEKEFDFTVFGATGYTGKYVFRNLLLWEDIEKKPRKIAIAGRNKDKLESLLKETALQLDRNLDSIGVIIAEVNDEESLLSMCERSKVILNVCGPYILYGEQVVRACIQKKAHMVDISGEPQYLEDMQFKYHEAAKKAGVYIVGACGYDAIPSDVGTDVLKQKFTPGRLNQVDAFVKGKFGSHGITINVGTLHSLAQAFGEFDQMLKIREGYVKGMFKKSLPESRYPAKIRYLPWWDEEVNGWCLPVPIGDRDIVKNSQRWFHEYNDEKPVQFEEYIVVPKLYHALFLALAMFYITILIYFNFTRKLLIKHPKIFTAGFFSKSGPTRKQLEETSFTFTCVGKGWSEPLNEGDADYKSPPNKIIKCRISGPDPGYETTSRCLIQSGLSILDEGDKMPFDGGCITPGFAFRGTTIRERLTRHNVTFEIIE